MTKKIKSTFHPLILETIKFLVANSVWVVAKGQSWANSLLASTSLALASMTLYILLSFTKKFRKPLQISVSLKNAVTKEECTQYLGQALSGDRERTVRLELEIKKNSSVLSWYGLRLVANKNVLLRFKTIPDAYMLLQPESTLGVQREGQGQGFAINISNIVKEFLNKPEFGFKRVFEFVIFKPRDVVIKNDCSIEIEVECQVDGATLNFFHSFIYDLNIGAHRILYFDNYMRA